jgi:hypothetical protein
MTLNEVIDQLVELTNGLHDDVKQASNRVEHIRLTARANEAVNVLHNLMHLQEATVISSDTQKPTDGE